MNRNGTNRRACIGAAFVAILLLPLVCAGQWHDPCSLEQGHLSNSGIDVDRSRVTMLDAAEAFREAFEQAYVSAQKASMVQQQIDNLNAFEAFLVPSSPAAAKLESMRKNLQDRLTELQSQMPSDKNHISFALDDWVSATEKSNEAWRRYEEAYRGVETCLSRNYPQSQQSPTSNAPAAPVPSASSAKSITPQDLNGKWETHFHNDVVRDKAEIDVSGNELTIINQLGQTGTGFFSGGRITVTKGWPDTTPNHPLYGTATRTADGSVKIEWGQLLEGHGSGGFWMKQ
jgi:hypothetical protein